MLLQICAANWATGIVSWQSYHVDAPHLKTSVASLINSTHTGEKMVSNAQIGELAGGMAYKTVSAQVKRFEAKLMADAPLRAITEQCLKKMSNVETPKKGIQGLACN